MCSWKIAFKGFWDSWDWTLELELTKESGSKIIMPIVWARHTQRRLSHWLLSHWLLSRDVTEGSCVTGGSAAHLPGTCGPSNNTFQPSPGQNWLQPAPFILPQIRRQDSKCNLIWYHPPDTRQLRLNVGSRKKIEKSYNTTKSNIILILNKWNMRNLI